jgi:L-cysteine:1D-myo-inositol 2-amino-2-deoxy-alpha-D-glucopyranoside ligase
LKRHYRQDYLWQRTETQEAERELASLAERLNGSVIPPTKKLIEDIYSAIADDLNTPMAISKINQWVNSEDTDGDQVAALELRNVIDAILGIELPNQT